MSSIQIDRLSKTFPNGRRALQAVSLMVEPGEMVGLIGASGSGKSTLIRAIAGLTPIDDGAATPDEESAIRLFGQPMQRRGAIARTARTLRARVGVIFQQFNLVPRLSVLTNVSLGLLGRVPPLRAVFGRFTFGEKQRAMRALTRVGIAQHALKRGSELSGGQQQRAAIARALVQGAEFIVGFPENRLLNSASIKRVLQNTSLTCCCGGSEMFKRRQIRCMRQNGHLRTLWKLAAANSHLI